MSLILLWFIAVLGNTWFWTSLVNRVNSLRLKGKLLTILKLTHYLGILAGPIVFALLLYSNQSHELLAAMTVTEIPALQLLSLFWGFSAVGWLSFLAAMVTRMTQTEPPTYRLVQSEMIDYQSELGEKATDHWTGHIAMKIPGNQFLGIELNEKEIGYRFLSDDLNGLKLLHLSDVHFMGALSLELCQSLFERLSEWKPDMIVFSGDLLDGQEYAEWIEPTFGQLKSPYGNFFILGNHDWELSPYDDAAFVRDRMLEVGWKDLAGRLETIRIGSTQINLGGSEKPWMGKDPEFCEPADNQFSIFVSHAPDQISLARKWNIPLMLSGHNHGGQVRFPLIGPCYSPSRYGVRFEGGIYQQGETVLHVSRGLSGKEPLRINCRPEVTLITLKSV